MEYRYTAIILKKREVGETDRIYTFLTREAGKVSSIARGVRKSEAKLAAALETGSQVDMTVVRTRGMGKIAGAVLEESWPYLRQNFETLRLVLEVLSMVDRLVEPEECDEWIYTELIQYLKVMNELTQADHALQGRFLSEAFLFRLVFHLGYDLELTHSVRSGERLPTGERYLLSAEEGGVMLAAESQGVRDGLAVTPDTIKCLRLFQQHPLTSMIKVIASTATLDELTRFRTIFLRWVRR